MNAPDMTTISPATPADVPAIFALVYALAEYENRADRVVSTPADFERELFGPNARIEAVVARVGEITVGFGLFFHNFSTFLGRRGLYLEDLFVLPAYRGQGVGKALLQHLAAVAVERKCGRFEWCVLDWNASAIAFYESMGATVLGDLRVTRVTGDALLSLAKKA
jgi:GNAT superfamily N-acetyltransferase